MLKLSVLNSRSGNFLMFLSIVNGGRVSGTLLFRMFEQITLVWCRVYTIHW